MVCLCCVLQEGEGEGPENGKIIYNQKLLTYHYTVYDLSYFNAAILFSVANPDLGSGAFLTPGSGAVINFFRIPDPQPSYW